MVAYNHKSQCSLYCARICVNRRLKAQRNFSVKRENQDLIANRSGVVREKERCCHDGEKEEKERCCYDSGNDEDEPDARPDGLPYANYDILTTIYSMITYVLDLGSDFWVAYYHFVRAMEAEQEPDPTNPASLHWYWFGLTLVFIFLPSLVMSAFSMRWYLSDYSQSCRQGAGDPPTSKRKWLLRWVFMLLQIGPVMRYIDSIHYGLKSRWYKNKMKRVEKIALDWRARTKGKISDSNPEPYSPDVLEKLCKYECKAKHYYDLMLYEDADAAMMRLFECFMESAPQTILQLYILSLKFFACPKDHNKSHAISRCKDNIRIDKSDKLDVATTAEMVSIVLSVTSIAWGLVAYHKALRFSRSDKSNVSHLSCLSMFLWRSFLIFPRVLVIALFASVFPAWHLAAFIGGHFALMVLWMQLQPSRFCSSPVEERVFRFFAAVIHVFAFFNLLEGRTRWRIASFYSLVFVENLIVIVLWMIFASNHHSTATKATLTAIVVGSFALGIFFMIFHYVKLHPNVKNIPFCTPADEMPFCCRPCQSRDSSDQTSTELCQCSLKGQTSQGGVSCQKTAKRTEVEETDSCADDVNPTESSKVVSSTPFQRQALYAATESC